MTETKTCPKCESGKIVPRARVIDRTESFVRLPLQVTVDRKPDAAFFTGPVSSALYAAVCGACGFTEFYAEEPKLLLSAYEFSQGRQG